MEFLAMRGAGVLLVAVLVAACNGGEGRTADTLPPPVETTSTTAVDYAVPAVIDVAYVEKVMAGLDRVYGDAIRTLAAERQITQEFLSRLAAIYGDKQFERAQRIWVRDVAAGLEGLAAQPGDPRTIVQAVVRSDADCVLARVDRDFSATHGASDAATPQEYIALAPSPTDRDPHGLNPTPWVITFDGYVASPAGAEPETPCGA